MTLEFNILWVEDNETWYKAFSKKVHEHLESLSFIPRFVWHQTIEREKLSSSLDTINFDLIFADLNLGDRSRGSEAIEVIRESQILPDILFYSTDGIEKIKEDISPRFFEGVYIANRDDLLLMQRIEELIDKLVKRANEAYTVRGMVLDNLSEFDAKLKKIILTFIECANGEQSNSLDDYAKNKVLKQLEEHHANCESCSANFITESLQNSFLIDSFKLSLIVNSIFKNHYNKYIEMKNFHANYNSKIINERNLLAHAVKDTSSSNNFYVLTKDGTRIDYDSEKCLELRKNIVDYHKRIDEATAFLMKQLKKN